MKKNELLAFRQHPILPITLEVYEDTTVPPHEDMQFSLTLTFRNTSVTKNGVVAKDAEEAAENASTGGMGLYQVAPLVWDVVIPDTFPWSARLKRAMIHLVSLAPSWETLDDWGMTAATFPLKWKCFRTDRLGVPSLDELEQGNVGLLPDEEPIYTEEQERYVRAYHIVKSVLDFDWNTADDQTLRRHPSWLSMEPEVELPSLFDQPDPLDPPDQEPDPLYVNEGEALPIQDFFVRVYEPVVTEWKTELRVPAHTQAEANQLIADLKKSGAGFPEKWVLREYLVEGTEPLPNISGNEYWEVSKHCDDPSEDDDEEDLNITPDMSGQRAFVWSFDAPNPNGGILSITPINKPCIPNIGHTVFGVLIAEKVGEHHLHKPRMADIPPRSLTNWGAGREGYEFWCPEDQHVYRIIWAFRNPQ